MEEVKETKIEEHKEEKKPKKGLKVLVIIIVSLILIAGLLFVYFKFIDKEDTNDGNNKEPETGENTSNDNSDENNNEANDEDLNFEEVIIDKIILDETDSETSDYFAVKTTKTILNNFDTLDLNNKLEFDITPYMGLGDDDERFMLNASNNKISVITSRCTRTINVKEKIKSIRPFCDDVFEAGCYGFYYLTDSYNLYRFNADLYYSCEDDWEEEATLIASDVESFGNFPGHYDGEEFLVYKKRDNIIYIDNIPLDAMNFKMIHNYLSDDNVSEIYVIPDSNDHSFWNTNNINYLKDENNNVLYVDDIFVYFDQSTEDYIYFAIGENDKLYYYPNGVNKSNLKATLYNDKIIKDVTYTPSLEYDGYLDDLIITFTDNTIKKFEKISGFQQN